VAVKICGITDLDAMEAAIDGGADLVGFVFYPPSPRYIEPDMAAELADIIPDDVKLVGLFVDADDATYDKVLGHVRLDMIQCHGKESPERVEFLRQEYGLPVMKAIPIESAQDFDVVDQYKEVADQVLFDTKPPKNATLPGGNAVSFDWSLLRSRKISLPWMLAGGLTPENVAEAIRISKAKAVDVSSGVEVKPGQKDPAKIRAFIKAAKGG
jgi:phosphoribosylanthranilate isomerase